MYSGIVAVDSGEVIRVEDESDKSPIDRSNLACDADNVLAPRVMVMELLIPPVKTLHGRCHRAHSLRSTGIDLPHVSWNPSQTVDTLKASRQDKHIPKSSSKTAWLAPHKSAQKRFDNRAAKYATELLHFGGLHRPCSHWRRFKQTNPFAGRCAGPCLPSFWP